MMKGKGKRKFNKKREKPEFDQEIVDLARVTRVTKGGKQLSFRACVVIGDRKGRVGYGVDKGKDVQIAVDKAVKKAKKTMIRVPIVNDTIPHKVMAKYSAARVMLKPAPKGSGVIAGSSVRVVLEMAGVPNASAKILGKTNNKINNIKATFDCLQAFLPVAVEKARKEFEAQRAKKAEKSNVKIVVEKKKRFKKDNAPKKEMKKDNNKKEDKKKELPKKDKDEKKVVEKKEEK